jgi:hypothetical protein
VSLNDESGAGDIIEQGTDSPGARGPRFGSPRWLGFLGPGSGGNGAGWRPPRGAAMFAAVALLAGLGVGYAAGNGAHRAATAPSARSTPSVTPAATGVTTPSKALNALADTGLALEQVPQSCSAQTGSKLQVGVLVQNVSPTAVTLTAVKPLFPVDAGTLRELSWQWEPCGIISYGPYQSTVDLVPNGTAWLSVTLQVKVPCPAADPVQFDVKYVTRDGVHVTASLPGFPDLTSVPYSGCPSPSLSDSAYSSVWSSTDDRAVTVDHW